MIYIVWEACLDVSKAASYQDTQKVSQFMRELEKNAIKLISAFQIRIQVVYIFAKYASFETITENHRNSYENSLP